MKITELTDGLVMRVISNEKFVLDGSIVYKMDESVMQRKWIFDLWFVR